MSIHASKQLALDRGARILDALAQPPVALAIVGAVALISAALS